MLFKSFISAVLFLFLFSPSLHAIPIEEMSLEEKVGQLFITYFEGEGANEQAERLINEMHIGGFIYYSRTNKLKSLLQIKTLSCELQELSKKKSSIPLLIAIDQEGGAVSHLTRMNHQTRIPLEDQLCGNPQPANHFFTAFPGNAALGRTDQSKLAYKVALTTGQELQSVGINLNFAPVIDIHSNPENPVIGIRSFSPNPEIVAEFGLETVKGFLKTGVIPCCKHFPGHGDTNSDSHHTLPVVNRDLESLQQNELIPFFNLLDKAPMIMSAHVLYPEIDPDHCATLSKTILTDLLVTQYKYKGVLITDSLTMKGITNSYDNSCEAALCAFEAGNDILLIGDRFPHDPKMGEDHINECLLVYNSLLNAVRDGRISEKRIDQSMQKILSLKDRIRNPNPSSLLRKYSEKSGLSHVLPSSHKQAMAQAIESISEANHSKDGVDHFTCFKGCEKCKLAKEIAYRSVYPKLLDPSLTFMNEKIAIVCPEWLVDTIRSTDLSILGESTQILSFNEPDPLDTESLQILQQLDLFDKVVVCSWDAKKNLKQLQLIKNIGFRKPVVAISTKDDDGLEELPNVKAHIVTFSPSFHSLQVASEWIHRTFTTLELSNKQIKQIGKKVWRNECGGSKDMLTAWNIGEPFPSLGIGHFIWPPQKYEGTFSEGEFHNLIVFLQKNQASVPEWLLQQNYAPWNDRQEFLEAFHSEEMKNLRTFLANTTFHQTLYMIDRLHQAFIEMVTITPNEKKQHLINQFFRVAFNQNGLYILIDYLNFKGSGLSDKQRYQQQGWGLLQVLENMQNEKKSPSRDFVKSAKDLLIQRTKNTPNKEQEEKWIRGWLKRLETYTQHS